MQGSLAVAVTIEDDQSRRLRTTLALRTIPSASLFWTTVQVYQGVFPSQNDADITEVIPSFGSRHASDYVSHWRFVPDERDHSTTTPLSIVPPARSS